MTATEVARNFSEVINRVLYQHESVVVERGGVAVCEIRPVYAAMGCSAEELVELLRSLPKPPDEYLDAVEEGVRNQPPAEDHRWRR
jgi:antitoxin (DNA-binding transcriptional repressor) of toxin-antitoxin stability system